MIISTLNKTSASARFGPWLPASCRSPRRKTGCRSLRRRYSCAAAADWLGTSAGYALPLAMARGGAILLYDAWLKRTWAGSIVMGGCRFLNVLLGLTAGGQRTAGWGVALALVIGVYVLGITWFGPE